MFELGPYPIRLRLSKFKNVSLFIHAGTRYEIGYRIHCRNGGRDLILHLKWHPGPGLQADCTIEPLNAWEDYEPNTIANTVDRLMIY